MQEHIEQWWLQWKSQDHASNSRVWRVLNKLELSRVSHLDIHAPRPHVCVLDGHVLWPQSLDVLLVGQTVRTGIARAEQSPLSGERVGEVRGAM